MREEDGDGLFGRTAFKRGGDVVTPELETEGGDVGGGDGVADTGGFDVEGAEREIGREDAAWDEGLEGVGWVVIFPGWMTRCLVGLMDYIDEDPVGGRSG